MMAIDHLNRYVSNVEKFINFYTSILKYEIIDKGIKGNGQNYAILRGQGHEVFISEKEDFIAPREQSFRHIGYSVENVDELLELLKSEGLAEKDKEIIVKPYSRQFYLRDPDGVEVDFIQWTDKLRFYDHLREKADVEQASAN